MYHQLLKIGEDGITAEIEYEIKDEDCPLITKIMVKQVSIPVGVFDLRQVEAMSEQLWSGHAAVIKELNDEARIDAYEERQRDLEI